MAESDPEIDALVGTTVASKYQIESVLGRGGMGSVYLATNTSIGKRVALKFLSKEAARNADAVERFKREARAAGMVESAHIVQVFDDGVAEDGRPFLVMELLRGEDLRALLKREGRLDLGTALAVATQVLRGLERAHAAGIVHRDLKPDNVFLLRRDDDALLVKIVDFGISKVATLTNADTLTHKGVVLGTAFYMSPEQAQAMSDLDGRTDLWSLGAILYEVLSGRPPITGRAYEAVLVAICTKDADDIRMHAPDVPESVARVIAKALCREREQRFASAREMLVALAEAAPDLIVTASTGDGSVARSSSSSAGGSGGPQTMSGTAVRTNPAHARRRTGIALGALALGALITAIALMMRTPNSPPADTVTHATRPAAVVAPGPSAPATVNAVASIAPSSEPASSATEPATSATIAGVHRSKRPGAVTPAASASSRRADSSSVAKDKSGVASGLPLRNDGP